MKRREFLAGLTFAGLSACGSPAFGPRLRSVDRVGLQLYTVRDLMMTDVAQTLSAVAEVGYLEVETAGTGNLSPTQFAQALMNAGLTAPSAHVPINLLAEQPESVLKAAQAIGYKYLVVPWLPPEMRTLEGYARAVDVLNSFGEVSAREGIQTAYHNHDFEFATVENTVPMQLLLAECDQDYVKFELDLFWAVHAGADAQAYLASSPDRYPLCHVKDRDAQGNMVDVGAGEINFAELFAAGRGLQHHFVEHDQPEDSLRTIQASFSAVKRISF